MTDDNALGRARKKINEIDGKMRELFVERMRAAEVIAEYKKDRGLPIFDEARENEVIQKNSEGIADAELREFYVNFIKSTMAVSRSYQSRLMRGLRVAYSGTVGAFAHIAAGRIFSDGNRIAPITGTDADAEKETKSVFDMLVNFFRSILEVLMKLLSGGYELL